MKANGMITLQRYVDVFIKTYFLEEGLPTKSWHMKSLDSQHLTKKNLIYNLKKAYILACMWKKMHVRILVGFWSFFCFHRINNWIHIFIFVIFFSHFSCKIEQIITSLFLDCGSQWCSEYTICMNPQNISSGRKMLHLFFPFSFHSFTWQLLNAYCICVCCMLKREWVFLPEISTGSFPGNIC